MLLVSHKPIPWGWEQDLKSRPLSLRTSARLALTLCAHGTRFGWCSSIGHAEVRYANVRRIIIHRASVRRVVARRVGAHRAKCAHWPSLRYYMLQQQKTHWRPPWRINNAEGPYIHCHSGIPQRRVMQIVIRHAPSCHAVGRYHSLPFWLHAGIHAEPIHALWCPKVEEQAPSLVIVGRIHTAPPIRVASVMKISHALS